MSAAQDPPARPIDAAVAQARAAIHDGDQERLRALLAEFPALVAWRGEDDQTLLDSTTSYAMDAFDPERERTYTRPAAAEMLIDAGATVRRKTLDTVIKSASSGMLALLARKDAIPRTLSVFAALGDQSAVSRQLDNENDKTIIDDAFLTACRFGRRDIALQLLDRSIALDPELGRRIDAWNGREAFAEFLTQQPGILWQGAERTPWQVFVILQLSAARDGSDLQTFTRRLDDESWVLGTECVDVQAGLLLPACYETDREAFIVALFDRDPALLHASPPPRSTHLVQALSYGNAHLIPLLTRIWPLPDDLPHAAGIGDASAVARWFDAHGRPALGSLDDHYPASDPQFPRADLHWGPPTVQQVLDVAFAFAVMNHHFAIAEFLLERGANINTDWATHEPASILHEAALRGDEEAVRFLIDHGVDLTKTDYRYQSTAEGWARHGSHDERMAELLAAAAREHARRGE